MRTSTTVVLERRTRMTTELATYPYEAAWAAEAIFFVSASGADHPALRVQAQLSPDGINWVDRGAPVDLAPEVPIVAIDLTVFGGWLRLVIVGATEDRPAVVLVHLVLKS